MSNDVLTSIKERSIPFSGDMVRQIVKGLKTETRRPINPQPTHYGLQFVGNSDFSSWVDQDINLDDDDDRIYGEPPKYRVCPYGVIGNRLWIRETFRLYDIAECAHYDEDALYCGCARNVGRPIYRADGDDESKWTPSIHMPRSASRILLEITGLRAERIQTISAQDAIREGIEQVANRKFNKKGERTSGGMCMNAFGWKNYGTGWDFSSAIESFASLWDLIYSKRYPWASNPWAWVIQFKVIEIKTHYERKRTWEQTVS